MKPHYPVTHRESRNVTNTVFSLCAGFLIGMGVTLLVVSLLYP